MPSQPSRFDIEQKAIEWVGTPFSHGSSLKSIGADCLGVIAGVLREFDYEFDVPGYQLEPSEIDEAKLIACLESNFEKLLSPQAGNILLFRRRRLATHLGICTQSGFVHAYFPAGKVVEVPLFPVWANRLHSVWELK